MEELEKIKEYLNKLDTASKIKLLGKQFSNFKLAEKILVMILERYETLITSLQNTKYLFTITLSDIYFTITIVNDRRSLEDVLLNVNTSVFKVNYKKANRTKTTHQFFHLVLVARQVIIKYTTNGIN